ncbi:TraR/DksA family transcriptional regulator [bacterium]|nr:TraR/DksA family transcriptional regulator [bacterium]
MNKKERDRYKKKLLKRKKEIIDQMSEFRSDSIELEPEIAEDVGDRAEKSYTKEFLLSLSNNDRDQLFMIDEALKRIEKDEFGICQRCHQKIEKKRLDALPWTPYCIKCQEKAEKESS